MSQTLNDLMKKLDELYGELDEAYDRGDYGFEIVMRMQLETMRIQAAVLKLIVA